MNHFLVGVLGYINGVLAIGITLAGAATGANWFAMTGSVAGDPPKQFIGIILGALSGLGIAAMVCGLLAAVVSIEKSMKHIAERAEKIT